MKYLTPTNLALLIIGIVILVLIGFGVCNKPKYIPKHKTEIEVLKIQNEQLLRELEQSKKNYARLMSEAKERLREDSLLKRQYEQRILKDYFTLEGLKNKKNEKIKVIDTASDSVLRDILSKY